MTIWSKVVGIFVSLILFHVSVCDRQVTFTCDGDEGSGTKGDPGPPGKRGPIGNPGSPGPIGPKGNTADVTTLEQEVRRLNEMVLELRRRSTLLPSIYHFHFPPEQVTWTESKSYCENLGLTLCSRRELYPRDGVMRSIGFQSGDNWVPVRDRSNGWIQIGDHSLAGHGSFHRETHSGGEAVWGETRNLHRPWKGHVFCCLA